MWLIFYFSVYFQASVHARKDKFDYTPALPEPVPTPNYDHSPAISSECNFLKSTCAARMNSWVVEKEKKEIVKLHEIVRDYIPAATKLNGESTLLSKTESQINAEKAKKKEISMNEFFKEEEESLNKYVLHSKSKEPSSSLLFPTQSSARKSFIKNNNDDDDSNFIIDLLNNDDDENNDKNGKNVKRMSGLSLNLKNAVELTKKRFSSVFTKVTNVPQEEPKVPYKSPVRTLSSLFLLLLFSLSL